MSIADLLESALAARAGLFDDRHQAAFRLFNGFNEGHPDLAIDLYARTALLHDYAATPAGPALPIAQEFLLTRLPWLACIVVKTRNGRTQQAKQGRIVHGTQPDDRVREHGVWYALDLRMNRDAGLYLDTRNLRQWIGSGNLRDKTVLNAFAYTGSLGVAAQAGGAARVVQLDLNRAFLNVAKTSCTLNGFPIRKKDFIAADFWPQVGRFKRAGETFDCVLLDPPFFAAGAGGTIDLQNNSAALINKVRPLVNDGGVLVAVNNALFLSGRDYLQTLESLCADGYLEIESFIPVPDDFTGYPHTRPAGAPTPPADPAPFNHATKIALLRVRRKPQ